MSKNLLVNHQTKNKTYNSSYSLKLKMKMKEAMYGNFKTIF